MRRGGSKQKGASFERKVCRELSLWVSHNKHEDLFWRSAMSGGRATVAKRRGVKLARQAGDISAVAPEGHVLTDQYFIEVKHVKNLDLLQFFTKSTGQLANFWKIARREARSHGRKPLLIACQNRLPTILMCGIGDVDLLTGQNCLERHVKFGAIEIWRWADVLSSPFNLE